MRKIIFQVILIVLLNSISYSQGCYYAINLPSFHKPDHKWTSNQQLQACSNATITLIATPNNICTGSNPVYWYVGSRNGTTGLTNIAYAKSITFNASTYSGKRISIRRLQTSSRSDHYIDIDINYSWTIPTNVKAQASSTSICPGNSVTLTGSGDAVKYDWSDGNTTDFPYNGVPFKPISTKTYTVTGSSVNGCYRNDAITIEVKPLVGKAGAISGLSSVCQGEDSVTYTTSEIQNANSYKWSLPPGAVGSSTTNSITIDYTTSASSGNLRVTGSNSCGQGDFASTTNKVISVSPLPAAPGNISGTSLVCLNQQNTYNYSVPVIANATSYVWTLPEGVTGASTTNNILVTYSSFASTGNISVKGVNDCGEGEASNLSISVKSQTDTPSFDNYSSYCVGSKADQLLTISNNGITGSWNPSEISTETSGTATYTFTPSAGQCATSVTRIVTVNSNATPSFNDYGPYCTGEAPAQLSTISTDGITGVWNPDTISTASAGATTYTFTPSAGQCATSVTRLVMVNSVPQSPVISSNNSTNFCQGDSVTLSTSLVSGLSYQWKDNGVNVSGTNSTAYVVKTEGSFILQVTNSFNCSSNSNAITTTTKPSPAIPGIFWNGTQLSTNVTGVSYQWYLNNIPIAGASSSVYSPTVNGIYKLIVTSNGCSTSSQGYNFTTTSTAYENALSDIGVKIYPNPVQNDIILKFDKIPKGTIDIILLNNAGVVLRAIKSRNIQTSLNVRDLSAGSYILKIINNNLYQVNKINILK